MEKANASIVKALSYSKKPYLAFSGGKDSVAMLHLVLKHDPDIQVRLYDFGPKMPRVYFHESITISTQLGAVNFAIFERYKSFLPDMFGVHFPRMVKEGYDLCFVGLRKAESAKRRRRMLSGRNLTSIKENWPLAEWTADDVWGYIFANNLPYHSHYDTYSQLYDPRDCRFSSYFDGFFKFLGKENEDSFFNWRYAHKEI